MVLRLRHDVSYLGRWVPTGGDGASMARLDQHHSFSADWHTSEPTPAETSAGGQQCASRHWRAPHFRETMDHPGDKAHCYHQHPVVKRKAPPGSGGILLSGHHRNCARVLETWRNDLWGL